MKPASITICSLLLAASVFTQFNVYGQNDLPAKRINFYVVDRPKTLDLFSRLVIIRAKKRARQNKNDLVVVVAHSSKEMKDRILDHLARENAAIGTIWFDSHGKYKNGYSSFSIGADEFSFKTIGDTIYTKHLMAIAAFADQHTRVAIGSCYGGATFEKPAHKGKPASKMNGDSLIVGLAGIFDSATVYGAESWVMTKPGTFKKHGYALSGYPLQKRFKDSVYLPVWEKLGMWNSYSTSTRLLTTAKTIALTDKGSVHIKSVNYLEKKKSRKKQARNIRKLRAGLSKT